MSDYLYNLLLPHYKRSPKLTIEVLKEMRFTIVFNNAIRALGWDRK